MATLNNVNYNLASMHKCTKKTHQQTANPPGRIEFLFLLVNIQCGYKCFELFTGCKITRRSCTTLPISSAFIDIVNQIGIYEVQPSLLIFYDCKGNHVVDNNANIASLDEVPDIIGVDEETSEDPQDDYDTTYIYIW